MPRPELKKLADVRYTALLVALVALILFAPVLGGSLAGRVALDMLMTVVLVVGLWSVVRIGAFFGVACVIAVTTFLARWSGYVVGEPMSLPAALSAAMFYPFVAVPILRDIMRAEDVSREHLSGAAAVYLRPGRLLGLPVPGGGNRPSRIVRRPPCRGRRGAIQVR